MFKTHVTALFTKKSKLSLNILFKRKKNGILHFFVAFISERTVQQKAPLLCVILLVFFVFNLCVLKRIWTSSINIRFLSSFFFFQIFFAEKKLYEKACLLPYVHLFQLKY